MTVSEPLGSNNRMSLPQASTTTASISPLRNFTIGPDEDFSVPLNSSSQSAWKLTIPVENDFNRDKTPEPKMDARHTLSLPSTEHSESGMSRRASCPNFAIPEFSIAPQENKRLLLAKRPSIHDLVSHSFFSQYNSLDKKLNAKAPYSPISEHPEISVTHVDGPKSGGNPSLPLNSDTSVKVAEMQTVKKQNGFFASSVSSLFSGNQLGKSNSGLPQNNQIESSSPTPVKKSYLLRRASALSNADMNAMAPTSM